MRYTSTYLLLFAILNLITQTLLAQDGTTCAQAIPITTGGNGGTVYSTCDGLDNFSAPGPGSCFDPGTTSNNASDRDLYFSFTPSISTCYNIIPYDTGGTVAGIFVYSGCPVAGNCVGGNTQLLDGINLQAGTQYIIVISTLDFPIFNDCFDFKMYISNAATVPKRFLRQRNTTRRFRQ
jgi:hypothetical protein